MIKILIRIIIPLFLLEACGHSQHETNSSDLFTLAKAKGADIYNNIDESIYKERCDKLTFKGMLSAYLPQDISGMENNGQWQRDTMPCYPGNSVSSISLDGILGVLHHIVSTKDMSMLNRLIAYGESHNWIMGQGPTGYTNMYILIPFVYSLRKQMQLIDIAIQSQEILAGFQGHLLADYIWLTLEKDGEINSLELDLLKQLVNASEGDPMYQALLHRVTDGNQDVALNILLSDPTFDKDKVMKNDNAFGWGSEPAPVAYLVALSIIEGR